MKHTLLIKVALCAAILLTSAGANASNKYFKKLAKIDGVEHVHIGKFLLNLAAKDGGRVDFGENMSFVGKSAFWTETTGSRSSLQQARTERR